MISYIVPTFNSEKYVEKCLQSIVWQKYQDIEVIIIDDGSKDTTPQICKKISENDSRVLFYALNENHGVSYARNMGLKKVKGDIVCFVDSDDVVSNNHAEFICEQLKEDIDILCFGFFSRTKSKYHKIYSKDNAVIDFLNLKKLGGYCWDKAYRREILSNVNFPEDMCIGEDGIFTFKAILQAKKIKYTKEPIYGYTLRQDSSSERNFFSEKQFDVFKQCEKIKSMVENNMMYDSYYPCFETTLLFTLLVKMTYYEVDKKYKDSFDKAIRRLQYDYKYVIGKTTNYKLKLKCVILFFYFLLPQSKGKHLLNAIYKG